jgi:hypothetical protein
MSIMNEMVQFKVALYKHLHARTLSSIDECSEWFMIKGKDSLIICKDCCHNTVYSWNTYDALNCIHVYFFSNLLWTL